MAEQRRGTRTANRQRSGQGRPPPRKPPRHVPRWRIWLKRIVVWGAAVAALLLLALGTSVYFAARSMPGYSTLMNSQVGQTIVVRARDGSEIVSIGPSYGQWLHADEIPQVMKDAMVAVEDRRYYSHFGIDPLGLLRAVYVALRNDDSVRATSTISQQLARNVFLNSNRTFDRKLREAVLAMALEAKFSKEQILELYLNKVYFGGGAYGIDSASRKFFSHSARELSTAEAAIIAGMVKAPSRYSPTADVDAAVGRANVVLEQMRRYGAIGANEAAAVDVSAVKLSSEESQNSARYFTDYVLPQLDLLLPNSSDLEPIEVWTTLDPGMQRAAASAVEGNTPAGAQGALVSLDRDGAILALVGGNDYVKSNYNRATEALRQPGSAWKLFVYLAALEAGYTPSDSVVDERVTIGDWTPRNSSGRYAGQVDVRTAFAYSINTVAAQLGNEVGFSSVAGMARRFGITTPISTFPSMVLGSSEVRVIDMTRAFAAVAAGGRSIEPYGITRVVTADGEVLYRRETPRATQLVPDYVAAGMTDLLQSAVNTGTGRAAQIGRPVAGKTGTTSSNKDGWFVGFSSGITTGVWMGRDDAKAVPGLQGGTAPARAFSQFMRFAVKDRPVEKFNTDVKLPEWQLEPDEEWMYGDPGDEYYYVDEQGNLIEPTGPSERRGLPFPPEGEGVPQQPADPARRPDPRVPAPAPGRAEPQAASDDFLDRATGRQQSPPPGGTAPAPRVP
jgi:penicillin-binding protein 1A